VYNVSIFAIPFNRESEFWLGYGFFMSALVLATAVGNYVINLKGLRSKVYGIPLISVIWRYLVAQFIVSLALMIFYFAPYAFRIGLALSTALLGACLIGLISVNAVREKIERIDEKIKEKVLFIKSLQADVENLVAKVLDESVKKSLKNLAETIKFSDPMSNAKLAELESEISAKIALLSQNIEKADKDEANKLCEELQQLFAERNRKCKILK